jgi:hypothetical protein
MMMPPQNPSRTLARRLRYPLAVVGVLVSVTVVAQSADDSANLVRRYPFDPACPWGRISNGKGMIVRCLSEAENAGLVRATASSGSSPAPASGTASGSPAPANAAAGGAGVGGASNATTSPPVTTPISPEELTVSVGPIVADQGELSVTRLLQPKPRYAKCVSDNGGMSGRSGEVHVRFLVRSRGIAEGVNVAKRVNVSAEAARCVAEIVDRRRVGPPEAPLVGATVVIRFDRATK